MTNKPYQIIEDEPMVACEPAVAYRTKASNSDAWNSNVPFHGTQEEFLEHIHRIEAGNFTTWEEHQNKFNEWKTDLLKSLMW